MWEPQLMWNQESEILYLQHNKINEHGNNTYITEKNAIFQSCKQYSHNWAIKKSELLYILELYWFNAHQQKYII